MYSRVISRGIHQLVARQRLEKGYSAHLFLLLVLIFFCLLPKSEANCTTIIDATKEAYFAQIDFIRRGMRRDTAVVGFADFMTYVISAAWFYNLDRSLNLGDVCLPDILLSSHQDENGNLLKTVHVVEEIEESGYGIPFLTETDLINNLDDTTKASMNSEIEQHEWKNISDYLAEGMPTSLNVSKLVFPSESNLRVEPFRNESCFQFEQKFDITETDTMSADNLTANVVALVLQLIDMGVNSTKARQLLAHNTAYTNMGVRCHDREASDLQVPLYFLPEYARQSALLSKNNSSPLSTKATATYVYEDGYNLVKLLSSYSSGGRLPTTVLDAYGNLTTVHLLWTSSNDVDTSILEVRESVPDPQDFENHIESAANQAINTSIYVVNELTATLLPPQSINEAGIEVVGGRFYTGSVPKKEAWIPQQQSKPELISGRQDDFVGNERSSSISSHMIPFTMRTTCGSSWVYVNRTETVTNELENCCAPICTYAASGLSAAAQAIFREACCDACNEYLCDAGVETAAQRAADLVEIDLPECGGNCTGGSVPVVI